MIEPIRAFLLFCTLVQMKLYSYIVKTDKGLAPNPFWSYCTLALCTPNHMGIKADQGDWIVGFTNAARGNKLVFR